MRAARAAGEISARLAVAATPIKNYFKTNGPSDFVRAAKERA
jgi:hypothetical protein